MTVRRPTDTARQCEPYRVRPKPIRRVGGASVLPTGPVEHQNYGARVRAARRASMPSGTPQAPRPTSYVTGASKGQPYPRRVLSGRRRGGPMRETGVS